MATAKKLPSGSWRCRIFVRFEEVLQPDGTYKKKPIYKSFTSQIQGRKGKAEAERMAAEYLIAKKEQTESDITVRKAMEGTIDIKKNTLSPTTVRTYRSMMNTAYPSIIDKKLVKLTAIEVQRCINDLATRTSPKYVKSAYGFLTSVMAIYAPETHFTIKLPQATKPDTYTPTDEEVKLVIDYLKEKDPELLKAVYLAAFGTLRRSEICAATAADLVGNTLHVHEALVYQEGGEYVTKTTKTVGSDRYVYLPDFVVERMPEDGRLVDLRPSQVTNRFVKVFNHVDVRKFRFHDLRHYSASIMHALGIPDQYIMQQGGWNSDGVLKRVYRNTMEDYQRVFAERTASHFDAISGKYDTKYDTE